LKITEYYIDNNISNIVYFVNNNNNRPENIPIYKVIYNENITTTLFNINKSNNIIEEVLFDKAGWMIDQDVYSYTFNIKRSTIKMIQLLKFMLKSTVYFLIRRWNVLYSRWN